MDGPTVYHKASSDYSLLPTAATDVSHSLNLDLSGFLYRAIGPQLSVFYHDNSRERPK